jgi:transposase
MEQATTIGLDIAKHVFQLHGADAGGHVLFRKCKNRSKPAPDFGRKRQVISAESGT